MCGLVGLALSDSASAFHAKDLRKAMSWLLKLDTYRVGHSTGVAAMFHEKETWKASVMKRPIPGEFFVDTHEYREFSKSFDDARVLLGHNRYATMGGMGQLSAHPHFTKDIVLCHNGTLRQFTHLADAADKDLNGLDSARVAAELQKEGSSAKTLENLIGDYALTWFDRRTGSLYLARNDARPLHYAVLERQILVWASEPWLIQAIAATCKMTSSTVIKELPIETMFEFEMEKFTVEYHTDKERGPIFNFTGVTETTFTDNKGFASYANNSYDTYANHYNGGTNYYPKSVQNQVSNVVQLGNESDVATNVIAIADANKILVGTGLSVGSLIDVTVNHVEYSNKKKRRNGWASGVSVGKPVYQVVVVSVNEEDFEDDAFSYQCQITGAAKFNDVELVIYVTLGSVKQRLLDPDDYAKLIQGDENVSAAVRSVLGEKLVVSYNENEEVDKNSFVQGPKGVYMSVKDFDNLVTSGCVSCGGHISSSESESIEWVGNCANLPLCPACTEESNAEDGSFVLPYAGYSSVVG